MYGHGLKFKTTKNAQYKVSMFPDTTTTCFPWSNPWKHFFKHLPTSILKITGIALFSPFCPLGCRWEADL